MSYQIPLKYILPVCVVLIALLVAAWAFGLSPVAALTERGSEPLESTLPSDGQLTGYSHDVVQVSGRGTTTGTPDLAEIRLSVSVTADTVADAWNTAAEAMQDVRDSLTDNKVQEKDINTYRIGIRPKIEYGPDGEMQTGYTASNTLNVTVRDAETVGTVLDAAVVAGGDYIRLDRFDFQFSDTDAMEQEARQAAIQNMEDKAAQIAESSGRTLGDLKLISEFPTAGIGGGSFEFAAAQLSRGYDTPVSIGEETVSVVVYGVYELGR